MTVGVLAGLLAALSLIALLGWSAVSITRGTARPGGTGSASTAARQTMGRVLLTVAAVSGGGCLVVLAVASFAEHL